MSGGGGAASVRDRLQGAAVSVVGGGLLSAVMSTTRSELIEGADVLRERVEGELPTIYVLWHGRLIPCAHRYRRHGFGTLITRNRDGDYVTGLIQRWGFRIVRGSSSRGGSRAGRELLRILNAGGSIALTPDGPRGPRQRMKLGPLRLAAQAGVPIVPVSAGASRGSYFGGWDRFLVPHPFARCPFAAGDAVRVKADADEKELRRAAEALETQLNALTDLVDRAADAAR